jgi:DNA-binding MarR family transcriptional regulator
MASRTAKFPETYQLDPVLDFMRVLWSVQHGLQRMSKYMENSLGVTGPQRVVLRIVARYPDISAGELAHILRLHPSTLTGILQRLVARGLLARQVDPADNRRVRLRLKAAGRTRIRRRSGTVEQAVTEAISRAGRSNVRAAREVLAALAERLDLM